MNFRAKYFALERDFEEQVRKDNEKFGWRGETASYYLPTVPPEGQVDFVFVAMEPSAARDADGTPNVARNFFASVDDFILHFCVRNYSCEDGQTYFITDVAKGAILTEQAKKTASKRWPAWYRLLEQELGLVSKSGAPVIAVGRGVEAFLCKHNTPCLKGSVLHYSKNASVARTIAPQLFPQDYAEFKEAVNVTDLVSTAEELMQDKVFDKTRDIILGNLLKAGATSSSVMLMFTYKALFEAMFKCPVVRS